MTKAEQLERAERLQALLLKSYEEALEKGTATAADRAALGRLLQANGWSIDPADVPQGIRSFLTKQIDPQKFAEDDADLEVH